MKKLIYSCMLCCMLHTSIYAQSWNLTGNAGTTPGTHFVGTTDAKALMIKVNNQRSGYLDFDATKGNTSYGYQALKSPTGKNNAAFGYKAAFSNTKGSNNVAIGVNALFSTTTGYSNIAIGKDALYKNTTISNLVAVGDSALFNNGTGATLYFHGIENTGVGSKALYSNTIGRWNTALGFKALYSNTTGGSNTATGDAALVGNTTGVGNTATGIDALKSNTTGEGNTATGIDALGVNTTGNYNTALGGSAGSGVTTGSTGVTTGSNNTFIGYGADAGFGNITNATALGNGAIVNANNAVAIGNATVTSIGGAVGWSNFSDGRIKKSIKNNVPGLVFINKLKPITYNLDLDAVDRIMQPPVLKTKDGRTVAPEVKDIAARKATEQVVHTGFVAQEVEKAAKELNYDFSGVDAAKNDKDLYGLRYAEFVVPLVKAVQELSKMNDDKDAVIEELKKQNVSQQQKNRELENRLARLEVMINVNASSNNQHSGNFTSATILQNIPNPVNNATTIGYAIPQQFKTAKLIITDKQGRALKEVNITAGKGNVQLDVSTFATGIYQYSLYADGKLMDSKSIMVAK